MKKIPWMIIAIAIVVIACLAFYNYNLTDDEAKHSDTEQKPSLTSLLTQFVDQSLNEQTNTYDLFFHCSSDQQECAVQHDATKPPHMGYAIMSLTHSGEKENDERLTEKATALLDKAIENCKTVDTRYCEWNFFPLHLYYQRTGNEKYLDAMMMVSESVTANRSVRELVSYNLPVKWWRLYDVTDDQGYLDKLTKLADEQLTLYPTERENDDLIYTYNDVDVRKFDLPMIWALYVPAYEASGDIKYLKPAMDFFRTADLSEHTDKFFDVTTTGDLIKGTESLLTLASADPENKDLYLNEAKKILEKVLEERWDTPEKKLMNGDYGILVSSTEKATNIQGWIAYVIFKLENDFGVSITPNNY